MAVLLISIRPALVATSLLVTEILGVAMLILVIMIHTVSPT